jgi:TP901 family phage tail tape measure protein
MEYGEDPKIKGKLEAESYAAGLYRPGMVKHAKTAYVDPKQVSDVSEDMAIIDEELAKEMGAWEPKITKPLKELAHGLEIGQKLVHGQVIGQDVEGKDIKFDLEGTEAEIEALEHVIEDEIHAIRIHFKEHMPLITGSKIGTTGGVKLTTRVEKNIAERYGVEKGTQVIMGGYGAAKRGAMSDEIKMAASEIARQAGGDVTVQEVADKIAEAMQGGAKEIHVAAKEVAKSYGVKKFTQAGKGEIPHIVGELGWQRLPDPRRQGPADIGTSYFDLPAMRNLQQRAGEGKMAEDMMARMDKVTAKEKEFIDTLQALAGATDVAEEGLRTMFPEQFKRLPHGKTTQEQFAGGVLDPEHAPGATAIALPERGGGDRLLRMIAMGKGLGERAGFKTDLGAMGSDPISRKYDQILETAKDIRVAEGRISPDVTQDPEAHQAGAYKLRRSIQGQVEELTKMDMTTKKGAAAARKFVKELLPVIDALNMPITDPIQFYPLDKKGKRRKKDPITVGHEGEVAGEFIRRQKGPQQQVLAIRDLLVGRAPLKGKGFENVETKGQVFEDAELLQAVLEKLGITMEGTTEEVEGLYGRMERLEGELVDLFAEKGISADKPETERGRAYAQRLGAGLGMGHKELTAVQFRTDVSGDLKKAQEALEMVGEAGQDVSGALAAVDQLASFQTDVAKIPRDAVFLNKTDYDNLVKATMKERKISKEEAERRLARPGLMQRYPVTGGASFLATRAMQDPTGLVEPGKIGVAGPAAVGDPKALATLMSRLEQLEANFMETIEANKGVGEAAERARAGLEKIQGPLTNLRQLYLSSAQNLDFDGDKIRWFGDTAAEAASGIETFTQRVNKGGVSFQSMMMNVLGGVKGGAVGSIDEYAKLFGRVAKGRAPGGGARLAPVSGETAQIETTAHIAGKKSVGLLTDVFNKTSLAITSGAKRSGDAFATGMDYINLMINESLAQKSGEGGVAGPLEFAEDLRAGRLDKIKKGMQGTEGVYGKMGEYNRQMRAQMEKEFKKQFQMKGAAGLKDIAKREGILDKLPEDITYENYKKVVDQMVNELDLESLLTRMFKMMKGNMIRALQKEGMSGPRLGQEMASMLTSGPAGGPAPGLDIDRMLKQLEPAYLQTRKRQVREFGGEGEFGLKTLMERAQRVMGLFPKGLAHRAMDKGDLDVIDFEQDFDPRQESREIAARVDAWYQSIKDTFKPFGRQDDLAKTLEGRGYTKEQIKKLGGAYREEEGPEGQIYLSAETRLKPLERAIEYLGKVAEGGAVSMSVLGKKAVAIEKMGTTLAHESMHKAIKKYPKVLQEVVRGLESGNTALGKEKEKLLKILSGKANIQKAQAAVKKEQAAAKKAGVESTPELEKAQKELMRRLGTELLTYQTDPGFRKRLEKAGVSEEAQFDLTSAFDVLADTDPLIRQAMEVTRGAAEAIRGGLMSGLKAAGGEGPDVGGIPFQGTPQAREFLAMSQRLRGQEAMVAGGTREFKMPTLRATEEGQIAYGEPLGPVPGEGDVGDYLSEKIREQLAAAREGFPDLGKLTEGEREIRSSAKDLEKALKIKEKDPDSTVAEGAGRKAYIKVIREFHQAVSVSFLNRARQLEKEIGAMEASGEGMKDPAKLADKMKDLRSIMDQHEQYLQQTMKTMGAGRGTMASLMATEAGEPIEAVREYGLEPSERVLNEKIRRISGPGKWDKETQQMVGEGPNFMKQMAAAIDFATASIAEGKDQAKAWEALMEALASSPKDFHVNLKKVADIMAAIGVHIRWVEGPLSAAAQGFDELAGSARQVGKATEKMKIETAGDMPAAMAEASKQQKIAYAQAKGPTGPSVAAQYEEADTIMKKYKQQLEKVIKTEGYQKAGAPKIFEPITKDIIDPETQKTIQRIRIEAKRMGKQIVTSMNQGGAAAGTFGNKMRSALHRVVQWGFASGVVYGMIRAFRNLVSTITEVQTKIMQLQKVMDTTITDFEAMQDAAVDMAKAFGIAVGEVLDGMVVYGQQGLKMNVIMERTEATLMAVNVTTLNATEATEALTAAHKVFGHEVSASEEFVDSWGAVAAKHAITAKDLANAVKRSGAAADVAGVGFDDFMGIITAIGAVTRQTGKEIATSTKFMFRAMRRPTAQKELARIDIKSLLPSGDLRPAMDIFKDIAASWDTLSRAQQINLAQAMAGIRHYNSFIVLMNNFDEAVLASAHAQESQGFAVRKNALAMRTFAKQMQVMRETVKKLTLEIGKAILPMVTGGVKAMSALVDILNKIPGPLMTAMTLFGGMAVAGVKAADLVVDSMDAIFGYGGQIGGGKGQLRRKGVIKTVVGGIKGVGTGVIAGAGAKELRGAKALGPLGRGAAKARVAFEGLGRAMLFARGAAASTAVALTAATVAMSLIAGAIYGIYYLNKKWSKSGKDVAKELEDQIGQSQDLSMQLRSQKTQIEAVAMSFKKLESAMARLEDPEALREALNSRNYKSASVAAKKYGDTMAEVSKAIALIDPDQIQGISETGEYIIELDNAFKNLTISAIDARNAITTALQTRVIKQFTKDLEEPKGFFKNVAAWVGKRVGSKKGFTLVSELDETNRALKKALDRRQALAAAGQVDLDTGAKVLELTQKRADLEADILEIATEIKKTMDAMPAFEDLGMAARMLPALGGAVKAAAPTGVFGRGATAESIMLKQMAKSAGTAGMFGYETGAAPGLMAGTLIEKGVLPTTGARPAETGAIGVAGKRVAELIAQSVAEQYDVVGLADMGRLAKSAQTMIAQVNEKTGEAMYKFYDGFTNTVYDVSVETVEEAVAQAKKELKPDDLAALFANFARDAMEKSAEETERILNMSFVGVMAGVRQPKGGMPDIGVGRAIELSPEQRVMKALALDMERLGEIQAEMNQLTKEYSEQVLTDVEGAYKTQAKSGQALKALTADMVVLVSQLQEEAFNLSVLAHYQKAIETLGLSMEKAAEAAREARIEEEVRAEYLVETAGALKGFSEIPQIDFGKTMKELTGAQRLAIEVPGFKGLLDQMKRSAREREAAAQQLSDIRKQRARFDEVVKELGEAGEKMTQAQKEKVAERAALGLSKAAIETIKAIEIADENAKNLMEKQIDIQLKGVTYLRTIADVISGRKERVAAGEELTAAENRETTMGAVREFGEKYGAANLLGALKETLRFRRGQPGEGAPEGAKGKFEPSGMIGAVPMEDRPEFKRRLGNYLAILNATESFNKQMADIGKMPPGYRPVAKAVYGAAPGEKKAERGRAYGGEAFEVFRTREDLAEAEKQFLGKLLEITSVSNSVLEGLAAQIEDPEKFAKVKKKVTESHAEKMKKQREDIAKKEADAYRKFHEAELKAIAGVNQATKELLAKDPARLAVAARDFANTIDNVITEFKKAEALEYTKIKSDLEGAFARVGKPGFKTDFETREEELKAKRMRPMGTEGYREMQKELAAIEFDEKEAKIKALQDIETAALRTQQQQAERMRTTMADALFGGQLEGSPELQKLARDYMDTLTQELATSEQAEMGPRGVAKFRGVPALEEATRVMKRVQEEARQKAAQAINKPIVSELQESNRYLSQIASSLSGVAALPPGATMGMAVGPGAKGVTAAAAAAGAGPRVAGMYKEDPAMKKKYEAMYKMSAPLKGEAPSYETGLMLTPGGRKTKARGRGVGGAAGLRDPEYKLPGFNLSALGAAPKVFGPGMPGGAATALMAQYKAQTGPINLSEYMGKRDKLPVGRSNYLQFLDDEAGKWGNDAALAGSAPRDPDRETSQEAIQKQEKKGGAPEADKEVVKGQGEVVKALGDMNKKMDVVVAAVAGMEGATDAVKELAAAARDPQEVKVTEMPSVTIDNPDQIAASLQDPLNAVGAELTDQRDTLRKMQTVVDPDGVPVDQRLEEIEADFQTRLTENQTSTIEQTKVEIDVAKGEAAEAKEQAQVARDAAIQAAEDLAKALEAAAEAKEKAEAARALAEAAEAKADETSEAGAELGRTVERKDQRDDADKREAKAEVDRLKEEARELERKYREAQKKANLALEIAKRAETQSRTR